MRAFLCEARRKPVQNMKFRGLGVSALAFLCENIGKREGNHRKPRVDSFSADGFESLTSKYI